MSPEVLTPANPLVGLLELACAYAACVVARRSAAAAYGHKQRSMLAGLRRAAACGWCCVFCVCVLSLCVCLCVFVCYACVHTQFTRICRPRHVQRQHRCCN
jgi:hypothetical protein